MAKVGWRWIRDKLMLTQRRNNSPALSLCSLCFHRPHPHKQIHTINGCKWAAIKGEDEIVFQRHYIIFFPSLSLNADDRQRADALVMHVRAQGEDIKALFKLSMLSGLWHALISSDVCRHLPKKIGHAFVSGAGCRLGNKHSWSIHLFFSFLGITK